MNIRYFDEVDQLGPLLHLKVAGFDRNQKPSGVEVREGGTLAWGVASVLEPGEPPPDLIYDRGDWGTEPMIRVLGTDPMSVVEKVLAINQALELKNRGEGEVERKKWKVKREKGRGQKREEG
jgi:hydroxymethylpyrimidine/phosphomethylpyrimidine kinase